MYKGALSVVDLSETQFEETVFHPTVCNPEQNFKLMWLQMHISIAQCYPPIPTFSIYDGRLPAFQWIKPKAGRIAALRVIKRIVSKWCKPQALHCQGHNGLRN